LSHGHARQNKNPDTHVRDPGYLKCLTAPHIYAISSL